MSDHATHLLLYTVLVLVVGGVVFILSCVDREFNKEMEEDKSNPKDDFPFIGFH